MKSHCSLHGSLLILKIVVILITLILKIFHSFECNIISSSVAKVQCIDLLWQCVKIRNKPHLNDSIHRMFQSPFLELNIPSDLEDKDHHITFFVWF